MIVYLCRHGIAVDIGFRGIRTDQDRCLSDEGQRKLHEAAKGYRKVIERPNRVYSSPYLRARQSAQILVEAFGLETIAEESPLLLPESDPSQALSLLQGELLHDESSSPILLVGHEPHLGELLALLLTGTEHAAIPLKKGMLAGVEIEDARSMRGQLVLALSQRAGRDLA